MKPKATHTPGPWNVTARTQSNGEHLYFVHEDHIGQKGMITDEQEANARLIAAAPELLEVLEETLNALFNETHGKTDSPWIASVKKQASAIIAKAYGN